MHIFTLAVPSHTASRQTSLTDSVPFLRVPQHTKFNSLCAVPTVARVRMHISERDLQRAYREGWNKRRRDDEEEGERTDSKGRRKKRESERERGDPVTWNHHHGAGEER